MVDIAAVGIKATLIGVEDATKNLKELTAAAQGVEAGKQEIAKFAKEINVSTASVNKAIRDQESAYKSQITTVKQANKELEARIATLERQKAIEAARQAQIKQSAAYLSNLAAKEMSVAEAGDLLRASINNLATAQDRLTRLESSSLSKEEDLIKARTRLAEATKLHNVATQQAAKHGEVLGNKIQASGIKSGVASHDFANMAYQLNDIAVTAAMGMDPLQILMQQGTQIGQIFAGSKASLAEWGAALGGALLNPAVLATAAIVAVGVAVYKTASLMHEGAEASISFQNALMATSGYANITEDQFWAMGESIAHANNVSQASVRELEMQAVRSGQVTSDSIGIITEASIRMAKAMGTDAKGEMSTLLSLTDNFDSTLTKLQNTYKFLTLDEYNHITAMAKSGDTAGAASETIKILNKHLEGQKENLGHIESVWRTLTTAIDNCVTAMMRWGTEGHTFNDWVDNMVGKLDPLIEKYKILRQLQNAGDALLDGSLGNNNVNLDKIPNGRFDYSFLTPSRNIDPSKVLHGAKSRDLNVRSSTYVGNPHDRGLRNNNPGNIEYGNLAIKYGAIGHDGRFAIFKNNIDGFNAQMGVFRAKAARGMTLSQAISSYAPEGENDTAAYLANVSKRTGVAPNQRLDPNNAQQMYLIARASMTSEGTHKSVNYVKEAKKINDQKVKQEQAQAYNDTFKTSFSENLPKAIDNTTRKDVFPINQELQKKELAYSLLDNNAIEEKIKLTKEMYALELKKDAFLSGMKQKEYDLQVKNDKTKKNVNDEVKIQQDAKESKAAIDLKYNTQIATLQKAQDEAQKAQQKRIFDATKDIQPVSIGIFKDATDAIQAQEEALISLNNVKELGLQQGLEQNYYNQMFKKATEENTKIDEQITKLERDKTNASKDEIAVIDAKIKALEDSKFAITDETDAKLQNLAATRALNDINAILKTWNTELTASSKEYHDNVIEQSKAVLMSADAADVYLYKQKLLNDAIKKFGDLSKLTPEAYAVVMEEINKATESYKLDKVIGTTTGKVTELKSTMKDAFKDWIKGGKDFADVLRSIGDRLLDMAINNVFESGWGAVAGASKKQIGSTVQGGLDIVKSVIKLFANEKGGVYNSPSLSAYSGQIVSAPTTFAFAKGGALGLMGEAGAEAIMPLKRGKDGKLGVAASGNNQNSGDNVVHLAFNIGGDKIDERILRISHGVATVTNAGAMNSVSTKSQRQQTYRMR